MSPGSPCPLVAPVRLDRAGALHPLLPLGRPPPRPGALFRLAGVRPGSPVTVPLRAHQPVREVRLRDERGPRRCKASPAPFGPAFGLALFLVRCRVEVRRGGLGRSLFSAVGPPFRTRVSHHLDRAPFPHPAHRTGRADLPHPALGQNSSLPSLTNWSQAEACGASPVPGPGTGDGRGIVCTPALAPCASHITTDGAVPPRGGSPLGRLGPPSRG